MNTITVRISGIEYNLKGDEPEEYLHKVAIYVDKKMQEIIDNNNMLSSSSACVLTAINATDEMFKAKSERNELSERLKKFEEDNKALSMQIESMKLEVEAAKKTNAELQERMNRAEESYQEHKEESESKLAREMDIIKETAEKYINECTRLKTENKEMKFQLQSTKYKIIDLEQKLLDNQINLAVQKKQKNAVINK